MLSERQRTRISSALDYVWAHTTESDEVIITGLIEQHGATREYRSSQGSYVLLCAGIRASSTTNSASWLVGNWRRNAVNRLSYLNL